MKFEICSLNERFVQNVARGLRIFMNGTIFSESIVSRIEIYKVSGSGDPSIFVDLFMGNICIATWVVKVVFLDEDRYSPQENDNEGRLYGYTIRRPHDCEK